MTYRSLFISDMHLGFKGCQTTRLLGFLQSVHADHIYLLGDIIDFEAMHLRLHWPETCTDILQKLFSIAKNGTHMVYIPGNHDASARAFLQIVHVLGNIQISHERTHTLADGRTVLLTHGDAFETHVATPRWLCKLGSKFYNGLLILNQLSNIARKRMGIPYWSLSAYLRSKSQLALKHIQNFEQTGSQTAQTKGLDGVICGHIHTPTIQILDGMLYANCGDWIENCTALAETHTGKLVLLDWKTQTIEFALTPQTPSPQWALAEA